MKHLIYFLLFSSVVFSQNYNYGIDEPQKQVLPVLPIVNNQLEEIEYFKAYLLPITKKATLQVALDTYGSVRLEKGDYSGVNIVMRSNQRLYGHPSITKVSTITVAAGSTKVYLESLTPTNILLQSGSVISGCTFKSIKYSNLIGANVMFENNLLINFLSAIKIDCSGSGYFRNNKIIRHQVHGNSPQLVMKGNSTTPSYGNVHLHTNFLTPAGETTDIDNLQSATFVGLDSEAWNLNGLGTKPMFYAKNMGDVKIADFGGANSYSSVQTPTFDIDANNLLFFHKYIKGEGKSGSPTISSKTNVLYYQGRHDDYVRKAGTIIGYDFKAYFIDDLPYNGIADNDITYNGIVQKSIVQNSTQLTNHIIGTQHTPWVRPTWETLPDPLGANWRTQRAGKPDSRAYIQNLIDTNGIAELPEGVFYIGSTLNLIVDGLKGIKGSGTGKTVICGLTDDFPLITLFESPTGDNNFKLDFLTLQGGSVGLYSPDEIRQLAFLNSNYVVFRNQNYGIHLYWNFGLDNVFLNNISFVNCNIGFFQEPKPTYDFENAGYVDKAVFYNGQFINCNTAISMRATRANNLNAWINCKFDNNDLAFDIYSHNFSFAANCDFTNHKGSNIIRDSPLSLYNCNFYNNNTTDAIIRSWGSFIEGCNFSDNIPLFSLTTTHYNNQNYILNSIIAGNVTRTYGKTQAVYVNSNFLSNPTLSKLLVNINDNIPTVIINSKPNPYPQFLVTQ
ncbi:hypothetical protein [Flavobacterium franklandianum]|uniref:Uncharacterized protein n=1 Tax=Flavobacterium franklandianum TaxID=2594430 RepID=A0A553CR28_9FLAO|nr:hypothetical protein [Flavobacterium franklandianum]TRX22993.1 hypothetical protein FNW17_04275 [Flavobacterium franklandianum]